MRTMRTRRAAAVLAVVLAAVLAAAAAGCSAATGSAGCDVGFELSLASATGGQPTPVAAARWFVRHGAAGLALPLNGWHVVARQPHGATVRAERFVLEVAQGPDGTWQVTSGRCAGA